MNTSEVENLEGRSENEGNSSEESTGPNSNAVSTNCCEGGVMEQNSPETDSKDSEDESKKIDESALSPTAGNSIKDISYSENSSTDVEVNEKENKHGIKPGNTREEAG